MKFLIIEKQQSYGCSYTIECGTKVTFVETESLENLLERLKHGAFESQNLDGKDAISLIAESWLSNDERERSAITIYEIKNEFMLPINKWKHQFKQKEKELEEQENIKKEKELFEKLKVKYA